VVVGQVQPDRLQEPVHAEEDRVGEPGALGPLVGDDLAERVAFDEPDCELVRQGTVGDDELPGHAHPGGHLGPRGPQPVPVEVHGQVDDGGPSGLGPFHGAAHQLGGEQFVDHGPQPGLLDGPPGQVRSGLDRFGRGLLDQSMLGELLPDKSGLEFHGLLVQFDRVVAGAVPVHDPRRRGEGDGHEPGVEDRPCRGGGAGDRGVGERGGDGAGAPGEGGVPLLGERDEGELACGDGGGEFDGDGGVAVLPVGEEGGAGDEAGEGEGGDGVGAGGLHGVRLR
jgi:hypothetical protein